MTNPIHIGTCQPAVLVLVGDGDAGDVESAGCSDGPGRTLASVVWSNVVQSAMPFRHTGVDAPMAPDLIMAAMSL
jgi:hypothetical protein